MKRCSFQGHTVKRKETSFKMELGSLKGELSHAHITTSYRPQTGPQAGHCLQPVRRSRCAPQLPPFFCKGKPLPCSLVLVSLTAVVCYSYMNWLCCFLKVHITNQENEKQKTTRVCLNTARLPSKIISSMLEHLVLHSLPGSYHSFHFTYIFFNLIYAYLKGKNSVSYSLFFFLHFPNQ